MSSALILEFDGVNEEQYNAVNALLGIDPTTNEGDWPPGLLAHTGAVTEDNALIVFEIWDSQASQEAFMAQRLGPALGQAGVPEPTRAEWRSVIGHHVG